MDVREELAVRAKRTKNPGQAETKEAPSITSLIKAMQPEIKKALPESMTVERFIRMTMSALSATPKLKECTPMSFLSAMMNAAQLGLEPNTPLGQAYLIPFKNKGVFECQFQIGYKGLIDLCYRNPLVQTIQAQAVHENDIFEYELGLDSKLIHKPVLHDRGEIVLFYGLFKLTNGGYGFEVMSKDDIDRYAKEYSAAFDSSFSPWKSNYISMAKKTVIKQVLKYAPLKADFRRALASDETVKIELASDMGEVQGKNIWETEFQQI